VASFRRCAASDFAAAGDEIDMPRHAFDRAPHVRPDGRKRRSKPLDRHAERKRIITLSIDALALEHGRPAKRAEEFIRSCGCARSGS